MELSWLEDYLALMETANFSRAAERRNLTQPALSRRIQGLEAWLGATLFDRGGRQVTPTQAGDRFRPVAEETIRRLFQGREEVREVGRAAATVLRFTATHTLALTFFPAWLRTLEARGPLGPVRLSADSMQSCERIMLLGQAHFLLCHHHPAAPAGLDPVEFPSLLLGVETLVPVAARDLPSLPGAPGAPVPYLAYSAESGMGRILAATRGPDVCLEPVFTSHVATVLEAAALAGSGLAWLPLSQVAGHLASGALVRAGGPEWDVPMEIRVYRSRYRQTPAAERFWDLVRKDR